MGRFFQLDNPVWRFIGNLADLFLLSMFWYLCCLPVVTIGPATTAMYYVTLKMTANQEGYTCSSFWRSFRSDFRQSLCAWLVFLLAAGVLGADLYWSLFSGNRMGVLLLPAFAIMALLYLLNLSLIFPLLARCENSLGTLLKMNFAMSIRSFLPLLSTVTVTAACFLTGIFLFWPLLLIAPGLTAYINSHVLEKVLEKYHLGLPSIEDEE